MLRTEHWTVQDTQTDGQGHGLKFQTVSVCIRCVRTSCQLVLCVWRWVERSGLLGKPSHFSVVDIGVE